MKPWILDLLRCPETAEALTLKDNRLYAGVQAYPLLNGVPWLFKRPGIALLEWGTKIQNFCEEEKLQIQYLQNNAASASSALQKKRLNTLAEARIQNLSLLKKSLEAFLSYPQVPIQPSTQQVHSYFQLFFRDWCWPTDELDTYVNYVSEQLTENVSTVLILGSAAGGLSHRLSMCFPQVHFVSLEHNPFLALSAEHIMQGKELKLSDYSVYPRSIEHVSQRWTIKTTAVGNNHQTIMGAFPELPFASECFDAVVCPWFLDILDEPFEQALIACKRALKADGKLIFFGPSNVHKDQASEQWTADEICACFERHFQRVESKTESVFYMDSPLNAQRRQEQLLFLTANAANRDTVSLAQTPPLQLKLTPELQQYRAMNETIMRVLSVVDKDLDTQELASRLISQFGFNEKEAAYYAEVFIRKLNMDIYRNSHGQ